MVLIPNDAETLSLIRALRAEIAQDRTDIQRLHRILRKAEFAEYPIPELAYIPPDSSATSSSSSSSSCSDSSCCEGCHVPVSGLTMTVTHVSGTATNNDEKFWEAYIGSHAQSGYTGNISSSVRARWDFACHNFTLGSTNSFNGYLFCSLVSGNWILRAYVTNWTGSGCTGTSGGLTTPATTDTVECAPFYLHATWTGGTGYTVTIEITE